MAAPFPGILEPDLNSALGSVIVKSVTFPVRASNIPLRTTTSPCPPESTTPASFNTGNISGVLASTSSA